MLNQKLKKALQLSPLIMLSCLVVLSTAWAGSPKVNQTASSFTATDLTGRSFSLEDYKGKNLVMVFYVGHR